VISGCAHSHSLVGLNHDHGLLHHQDRDRTYEIFVPTQKDPRALVPLVLAFHGARGTGTAMAKLGHLDELAVSEGFILVTPDGVDHSWNDGRPGTNAAAIGVDDVGFIRTLLDELKTRYPIDPARVYAIGLSNGGMFAHRLGCDLAGRITAVAAVGAALSQVLSDRCSPSRAVPVISFNGTEDPLIPYSGGFVMGGAKGAVLSAKSTRERWAILDGCTTRHADKVADDASHKMSVKLDSLIGCHDGAEVVTYTIEGGGHTWPGGLQYLPQAAIGRTTQVIDAGKLAWDFFKRFQNK
jgi:polyhydroxybutyrate depolymerase